MAKYSYEFKQKVVREYLEGKGSYEYIAKQNNIPDKKQVRIWVNAYKEFGEEGLLRSRKKKNYSFQFKLSVVELYLSDEVKPIDTSAAHIKELEDENLKLRIENAYLKELRRLRLEEETLLKKQRESSTVSEDSSN